jgi:hypothetical protein
MLRKSVLLYLATTGAQALAAQISPPTDSYSVVQRALLSGDAVTLAPYWREVADRLTELAAALKASGVPAILLVFPSENEVRHEFPKLVFAQKLREIWAPTGFPIIDLTLSYRASLRAGANPFLPYDLHPNEVGMRIAANALYDVIRQRGYVGLGRASDSAETADGP